MDGSTSIWIKNSEAHKRVQERRADWVDSSHSAIYNLPKNLQPSDPSCFTDAWRLIPSAGIPVWKMLT